MSATSYLILSCDGGGIRGLITALLLQDLSSDPQTKDLLARVNLFAGTSTGGIISLALASGMTAETMVELYQNSGSQIFQPAQISSDEVYRILLEFLPSEFSSLPAPSSLPAELTASWNPLHFLDGILQGLKNLVMARYDHSGLQALLTPYLTGTKTLADLDRKVMVTTLRLSDGSSWQPIVLTNLGGAAEPSSASLVLDAALCTGAAPTFFPPYNHPIYGYCADGGVFANNPSTLALTTACAHNIDPGQIRLLSLGTGSCAAQIPTAAINYYGPQSYGVFLWMSPEQRRGAPGTPLLNALMDNVAQNDVDETRLILGPEHYQRGNVQLTQNISLDDSSPATIQLMEKATSDYIKTDEWKGIKQNVARWLQES
ncbi:MAG TPA: patatin-like phospholipase family protein [Roseiflexaceae bacterium]|nr:patatin-like phospholipase family protein [Roseiflexaceae bacterium]